MGQIVTSGPSQDSVESRLLQSFSRRGLDYKTITRTLLSKIKGTLQYRLKNITHTHTDVFMIWYN